MVPRHRGALLPRTVLWSELKTAVSNKRLILASAPPGYGKTTLLAQLATHLPNTTAWYQIDAADGDPTIFLSYFIACLRHIQEKTMPDAPPMVGHAALTLLNDSESETAVSSNEFINRVLLVLINELAVAITDDWLVILEDYHRIANPDVHTLVQTLLDKGPQELHLVISSRTDPPLALGRLRARGLLAEFRSSNLRFNQDEVGQWLDRAIPGSSDESARLLSERTEGWAAALQIVLSSLSGKDVDDAEQFIAELSGSQRFIFQYLAEEVLQQQPPERRRFLMITAVLEQMNAAVCNAILGTKNAQVVLDRLEKDNLFVVSLDERRAWYRYHHLFRDFLLGELRRESPEELVVWEKIAGAYYEKQAAVESAFTHYIRARAFEDAARMLAGFAGDYVERGRIVVLQHYLADFPETAVRQYPELLLQHGNVLRRLGQVGTAVSRYEDAQAAFAAQKDNAGVSRALTQLSRLSRSQGHYRRAQASAAKALSYAPADDHASRAQALMALAQSEGFLNGMDRGQELAEESVEAVRLTGDTISSRERANLLRSLGHICWWHGDPQATLRYCKEALQSVHDERSPTAASIYITMAIPYVYRCDLDTAQHYAELGLEIARQLQLSTLLPHAYSRMGNILTRRGQWEQAETHLREAVSHAQGLGLESYARVMATGYLAQNLIAQGRLDEARQLAEGALWEQNANLDTYEMFVCRSVLADIALERDDLDDAQAIFKTLEEIGQRRQFHIPLAMVYFGLAYITLKNGRLDEAIDYAVKSVSILERSGTWQLFLDQGTRARLVCTLLVNADRATPFVHQVLQWLPQTAVAETAVTIHCFGEFQVLVNGEKVTQSQWVSTKARDLLACFVTSRHKWVSWEHAADAIWPETERQKRAFHSALYRLRSALRRDGAETKFVLVKGGEYRLDDTEFTIDVDLFDKAITQAKTAVGEEAIRHYREAIALYRGDYLNNLLYYDWAALERQRLSGTYLAALQSVAAYEANSGHYQEAIVLIEKALQIDMFNEENYRAAMRYSAQNGDKAGLIRRYQKAARVLMDELGIRPSRQTELLYQNLLTDVGI